MPSDAALKAAREAARFWSKVDRRGPDECWAWVGSRQHNGYGCFHRGGHVERHPARAHRFSWEIHNGPIPDGLWVLHRCDNPPCVNPAHLFLGTRRDNMLDAAAKGRVCTVGKARLTHCKRGHEFSPENTRTLSNGHRECVACQEMRAQKWNEQRRCNRAAAIRARGEDA